MIDLRKDFEVAINNGDLLQVAYKKSLGDSGNRNAVVDELVAMHNEGLVNIVGCFKHLKKDSGSEYNFFLFLFIFQEILPQINNPVKPVMDCVIHLFKQAGENHAVGPIFEAFTDFCAADPSRPGESLRHINESPVHYVDFLLHTIIAGSRIDGNAYLENAIGLAEHENIEFRRRAILALGNIKYSQDNNLHESALACLESAAKKEPDDLLFSNIIRSAFHIYKHDNSLIDRVISIINCALSSGGDLSLLAASWIFGFEFNKLPKDILDVLLESLKRVKPQHNGILGNLEFGLKALFKREDPSKAINFLESVLLSHPDDLSIDNFVGVGRALNKNLKVCNKLLTRWLLKGEMVLCKAINSIVCMDHEQNALYEVDLAELNPNDSKHLYFLARKIIGYLFYIPVSAASFIISLMKHADDADTVSELGLLIFNPLILNYPNKVKEYLKCQVSNESGEIKAIIEKILNDFDQYMNDLKSIQVIPELHPSQVQRNSYQRHINRIMSESFKKAEKQSPLAAVFSKSVLLYGQKSINYINNGDGQSHRSELLLQSHETTMEIPRLQIIDSIGLNYMLNIFRAEFLRS